ncbi:CAP domain-containing protein [Chitinophaga sp. MM2321]|uniref:CAP domain-containing protein n=1 Tax=Chitinophaga sp. MM2321 TaxID=3137178 RepID=UPI0032D59B72
MSGRIICIAMLLLAFSIFSGCAKDAAIKPSPFVKDGTDTLTIPENKIDRTALIELVNGLRSRGCNCGDVKMPAVGPLTWSGLLEKAAYLHSKDMALHQYFDHTGLDGSTPGTRMDAAGYRWNKYGENIASGQMEEQAVIMGWLSSPQHCKNMMDANFTEVGIGLYDKDWTMELGRRSVTQ